MPPRMQGRERALRGLSSEVSPYAAFWYPFNMSLITVEEGTQDTAGQLRIERPFGLAVHGKPLCAVPTDGLFMQILWGFRMLSHAGQLGVLGPPSAPQIDWLSQAVEQR